MTPEQIAEGRRVLADALRTDAMPVTARERDLAQSEYRVWVENNLRELLDVAEDAARLREALAVDRRDRFIAAALTGLCANPDFGTQPRHFAEEAILRADAVIAELDKERT